MNSVIPEAWAPSPEEQDAYYDSDAWLDAWIEGLAAGTPPTGSNPDPALPRG